MTCSNLIYIVDYCLLVNWRLSMLFKVLQSKFLNQKKEINLHSLLTVVVFCFDFRIMSRQAQLQADPNRIFLARTQLMDCAPCQWMPFWRNFEKTIHMNHFKKRKESHLSFHDPLFLRSTNCSLASFGKFLHLFCICMFHVHWYYDWQNIPLQKCWGILLL